MKYFKTFLPIGLVLFLVWFVPVPKGYSNNKETYVIPHISSLLESNWKQNSDEFTIPNNLPPMLEDKQATKEDYKKENDRIHEIKMVSIDKSYRVNQNSLISAAKLDEKLQGVLRNKGEMIIQYARNKEICPIFLTAVLIHESGNGTSNFAKNLNNVAGIMKNIKVKVKGKWIIKSVPREFDSVDACIKFTADLFASRHYAGGKLQTIHKIQQEYCPEGAANDPYKLNGHWLGGVIGYMHMLWGKTVAVRA